MCTSELLTSNDVRTGWVKPLGSVWRPVQYAAVDGLAVFEGCVLLGTVNQMEATAKWIRDNPALLSDPDAESFGVGIVGEQYRWPDATVPFAMDSKLPQQGRVLEAIEHWRQQTSVKFKACTPEDKNYVLFVSGAGCASYVGMQGGAQQIIVGPTCTTGNVIHEIGHAIGLWHEQSRADREQYIDVSWCNIEPLFRHNFEQHIDDGEDLGPYDYASIMHYPADAFSRNGKQTIRSRDGSPIGQREKLSSCDIASVGRLYP